MSENPDFVDLGSLTVEQLRAYAAESDINLHGATKKADIVDLIAAAPVPAAVNPVEVATQAVDAYIGRSRVDPRKRDAAITRHTAAVAQAGGPVDLDWYTQQLVHPARGVVEQ
jgi:hypothetical protein